MANVKDFQVNYLLNVQAADAISQLQKFSAAVAGLSSVDSKLKSAAASVNNIAKNINKTFGGSGTKKAKVDVDTKAAEAGLDRVISKLSVIESKTKNIRKVMSLGSGGGMVPYNKSNARGRWSNQQASIGGWGYPAGYTPRKPNRGSWQSAAQTVPFYPVGGGGSNIPPIAPRGGNRGNRGSGGRNMQNAAINRMHYSSMPSWRQLPFAGMLNAYFMYHAITNELSDAVQFTHTVDAAKQVLMTTDSDLSTFSERFSSMMATVRKIGVDTRFTMVDMAKATQFMAQAGFSTDQITQSISPISNLALIADTNIQDIADNLTGMLSGYRIDTGSAGSLADQLASTYTRSKATIQEMAESFKMSAGFLQMAGVDVSEAIAAFGVLGNANLRGTMAGTSVRSMMTFLAKPSKGSKKTLAKLGVETTETVDVYGKSVTKLRSLADIFTDLKKAGASLEDMASIFGKIGGTGAMILASRADELRALTNRNLYSHGLAQHLGEKKQQTTSGLWEQVTSQWSESFTQVFESLEPRIKLVLKNLTHMLSTDEFTAGLRKLGESMLTVFDVASKIGVWVAENWSWIQPVFIGGMVAKGIMSIVGALSNLVVVGRAAMAGNIARNIAAIGTSATGVGASLAGVVNTGRGLTGAVASIGALGAGALAVTGVVAGLGAAMAVVGYEWYQFEKRKEALLAEQADVNSYRFPSIEALTNSIKGVTAAALAAKTAKDELVTGATVSERYSNVDSHDSFPDQALGWIKGVMTKSSLYMTDGKYASNESRMRNDIDRAKREGRHKDAKALEDELKILRSGGVDSNERLRMTKISENAATKTVRRAHDAAWAYLESGEITPASVDAALDMFKWNIRPEALTVDESLYYVGSDGKPVMKEGLLNSKEAVETRTHEHKNAVIELSKNQDIYNKFLGVKKYLSSAEEARKLTDVGLTVSEFQQYGYKLINGKLVPEQMPENATEEQRAQFRKKQTQAHAIISETISRMSHEDVLGSRLVAAQVLKKTGLFPDDLLKNVAHEDGSAANPSNYRTITGNGVDADLAMAKAGGNYGGAGKFNSVAPKQVVVTIENLMSIDTIKLMGTEEGQSPQMQDLKSTLTQLLLEVVHDFDSSWNA